MLLTILSGALLIATLKAPRKIFPLERSLLLKASEDRTILPGITIDVTYYIHQAPAYSYDFKTYPVIPTPYARQVGIGISEKEDFGAIGFFDGPSLRAPRPFTESLFKDLLLTMLKGNPSFSSTPCPSRAKSELDLVAIHVRYFRPMPPKTYISEIEEGYLCFPISKPGEMKDFLDTFDRKVVKFAELALKKYPPKKEYVWGPSNPNYKLISTLTDQQVSQVEKELEATVGRK